MEGSKGEPEETRFCMDAIGRRSGNVPYRSSRDTRQHVRLEKALIVVDAMLMSERNAPCPCGSGRKYKYCHGKPGRSSLPARAGNIQQAALLFRQGLRDAAFDLAIAEPPSVDRSRLLVSILVGRHRRGDIELAQSLVTDWIRGQGQSPEPWSRQFEIHLFHRRYDRAADALTELRRRAGPQPSVLYYEAVLLQLEGKMPQAFAAYRKSVRAAAGGSPPGAAAEKARAAHRMFRTAAGLYPGSVSRSYLRLLDSPDVVALLRRCLREWESDLSGIGRTARAPESEFLAKAWLDLGLALMGDDECITCFDRAIDWDANLESARINRLLALNYSAAWSDEAVFDRHIETGRWFHARYPGRERAFRNDPDPERKIRIGYLSSDFREHPVAHFIVPVLKHHDRNGFEIYLYHNDGAADEVTAMARRFAHRYVAVGPLGHEELAARIVSDRIDILFDLNGYAGRGRIPVLARRAAPVQLTWIGYPNTTGLATVDYRIVDRVTEPTPDVESCCTEKRLYLPRIFCVYDPLEEMPAVAAAPGGETEAITFGSFNNWAKINPPVLETWAEILRQAPGSRLVFKDYAMEYTSVQRRILDFFAQRGVAADRIRFQGLIESRRELFEFYGTCDIALDTFPYNGTTTTCEALFMGLPVVALAGTAHRSRVSASLLGSIGLSSLVADSVPDYIEIATRLARDRGFLADMRRGLRERMQSSPLMDASGFTAELEFAIREAWKIWCENPPPTANRVSRSTV